MKVMETKDENLNHEKCTAGDDTSSLSAAALRDGRTPHSYPQLRELRYSKTILKRSMQEGKPWRRTSGGEIEADVEFVIKERKSISDAGFGCVFQPGEIWNANSEISI